ncbi:MAG: SDR family oxidoreductase [Salinispira sp.]
MDRKGCLIIGASGGIGREVSMRISSREYRLFVHGKSETKLNALVKHLGSDSIKITKELMNRSDIYELINMIRVYEDQIDIAVIGFGPFLEASLADMSHTQYEYLFDMNVLLPSLLVTALAPRMAERNWGRIVLFGGTGTDRHGSYRRIAAYSAAKYALNSLVRSAGLEFGKQGVTVNLICPGYVKTEYYSETTLNILQNRGLLQEPETIADIVEFLISDKSAAINGAVINADSALGH